MAELIALYSPPMPMPVTNRQAKKNSGVQAKAVAKVAARYTPSVIMNSFLRPNMSVRRPNSSAPKHAPATYIDAAQPAISAEEMLMPLPLAEIAPAIEPTIVTSSPSRIHTVPRPMRMRQCQLRPRQPVEPGRDVGLDGSQLILGRRHSRHAPYLLLV